MRAYFERALERADQAGLPRDRVVLDPGIGFGQVAGPESDRAAPDRGTDRARSARAARHVTQILHRPASIPPSAPQERLPGTLASHALGILAGVAIVRAHDVAAHVQAVRVLDAIRAAP